MICRFAAPDGSEQQIEILAHGQQVVLFGVHPDTQRPYSWHGGEPGEIKREEHRWSAKPTCAPFLQTPLSC
jgi:hypothetical protein